MTVSVKLTARPFIFGGVARTLMQPSVGRPRAANQGLGAGGRADAGAGAVQGQDRIHAGGGAQDLQGLGIAVTVRVPQQVDGIGARPARGQDLVQSGARGGAQFR